MDENRHHEPENETPDVSHISNVDVSHEVRDVNISGVLKFTISLAVLIAGTIFLMRWLATYLDVREEGREPAPTSLTRGEGPRLPPEPRLQGAPGSKFELQNPLLELEAMRREEDSRLTTYGWVDQGNGIVRLPIERAKQLVIERGLPVTSDASVLESPSAGAGNASRPR